MNKINKNKNNITDQDYMVMKYINDTQKISQRELSKSLNISLGKVNYILKALINKGIIKAINFTNSKNKRAYAYYLTTKGIQEKTKLAFRFFERKSVEYDRTKKRTDRIRERIS